MGPTQDVKPVDPFDSDLPIIDLVPRPRSRLREAWWRVRLAFDRAVCRVRGHAWEGGSYWTDCGKEYWAQCKRCGEE